MWFADRSLEDPICLRMCQCSAGWLFQNTYPDSTFSYPGGQKRGQQIIVICCCDRWLKYQPSCMWTNIPTTATAIPRSSSLSQHWLFVWNIFYCSIYSSRNNNPNWLIFFRRVETTNQILPLDPRCQSELEELKTELKAGWAVDRDLLGEKNPWTWSDICCYIH